MEKELIILWVAQAVQCSGKVGIYIVLWLGCICIPVGQASPWSWDASSAWIMLASPSIRDVPKSLWALTAWGNRTLIFYSAEVTLYKPALLKQSSAWNGINRGQVLRSMNHWTWSRETAAHPLESVSFSHFVLRWVQGRPFRNICKWKWFLRLINQWFEYVALFYTVYHD